MKKQSAGLVVYKRTGDRPEVLLAHMGAPWWAKKDTGAWSIPKGEYQEGDNPLATAKREFKEELSLDPPEGTYLPLDKIVQKGGKEVIAWAIEADLDVSNIKSNTFKTEWPPRSGKIQEFPEIDRAGWFSFEDAIQKSVPGQDELFERLAKHLNVKLKSSAAQSSLF